MAVVKKKPLKKGSTSRTTTTKKRGSRKLGLKLPTKPSIPSSDFRAYTWLLYGLRKIGKTSLLAMFDGIFFFMFEPGGEALSIMQRPVPTWKHFVEYVDLVLSPEGKHIKYVAIDTADFAWRACQQYTCEKNLVQHPSDMEWGKGYDAVKDEWSKQMNRLISHNVGVVFTSHYKEIEIKRRRGGEFSQTGATLPKTAREYLEGLIDIWTYYTFEDGQRVLYLKGDEDIAAGHRLVSRFRYTDGTEIKKLNIEGSPKIAYDRLMKAFNNQLVRKGGTTKPKSKKKMLKRK